MARKYFRVKEDGYVMNYNPNLDIPGDVFESDAPPPEFIPDLLAFLASGKVDEDAVAKVKRGKKADPVFLKNADGSLAA